MALKANTEDKARHKYVYMINEPAHWLIVQQERAKDTDIHATRLL
jgi:hypothetical protein